VLFRNLIHQSELSKACSIVGSKCTITLLWKSLIKLCIKPEVLPVFIYILIVYLRVLSVYQSI